jgi:hypothetical protein
MIVFLAADEARKKYDESNSKLKDTEQELSWVFKSMNIAISYT